MKVRVTLMTENDNPLSDLGENPEEKIKRAWEFAVASMNMLSEDSATLENIEIVE